MCRKSVQRLPACHVPELDGAVVAGGGENAAVLGKRQTCHGVTVPFERGEDLARSDVPQFDGLVRAPRGQRLAVRRISHGEDLGRAVAQRRRLRVILDRLR